MSEPIRDARYWTDLREMLKAFSQSGKLERYLFNAADFEELINVIFDDLDVLRHLEALPDRLSYIRSFAEVYFKRLDYLIGDGSCITREAPIYDPREREILFSQTATFIGMLDELIGAAREA